MKLHEWLDKHTMLAHVFDLKSLGIVVTTVVGWLPAIAALLSVVWTLIRIYDRVRYGPPKKGHE